MPPFPIQRLLVPPAARPETAGFTVVEMPIVGGLPLRIALDAGLELVLVIPNGVALVWRDADPTDVVSHSDTQLAPSNGAKQPPRPPIRLLLRRGLNTLGSLPLTAGARRLAPDAEPTVEIVVTSWDVRAGSLRGPGEFGSRIALAWRRADRAGERFSPPALPASLAARLPTSFALESRPGEDDQ